MTIKEIANTHAVRKRWPGLCMTLFLMISSHIIIVAQSTVSSSGANGTGSGGSVSYTIGQVDYTNLSAETGSISLGVQQPNLFLTVGMEEVDITLSASLYPNPANTSTSLKLESQNELTANGELAYSLFDMSGKLLQRQPIHSILTIIPMDQLTNGVYILQVTRDKIEVKSFKVFKTN
ncbi:MAG TPA: T9SS type A sorting domain-containing protein [Saprospiraceae bacterium]|nr:T9SS type A sorting domain-containing protein [Saprospiraceae bacterium]